MACLAEADQARMLEMPGHLLETQVLVAYPHVTMNNFLCLQSFAMRATVFFVL